MEFQHVPVLLHETIEGLNIKPDGIYVDGTAGGAGHSSQIAMRLDAAKGCLLYTSPSPRELSTSRMPSSA